MSAADAPRTSEGGGSSLAFEVDASFAAIDDANARIERFLGDSGVGATALYRVRLVVEELLTNVAKYAYDAQPGAVAVSVAAIPGGIRVVLSDAGRPFDPTTAPPPAIATSLDDAEIGGLGLLMVRKSTSSLTYSRTDGRNVVEAIVAA